MTQDRATPNSDGQVPDQKAVSSSYYTLLGLHPSASVQDIRQAYRELSKLYHPDITQLPAPIATQKFQQLNEAYATLSNPDRKTAYDLKIGYSRVVVVQPLPSLNRPQPKPANSSAYIDATDRPLSPGEMFALFILGLTFLACLLLAITIGFTRGESAFQPITADVPILQETVPDLESSSASSTATVTPVIPAPSDSIDLSNPT
ncbi:J domain-containing protein [Phormidesmis priestleyi]|uniref:J domain-containing protein n=1 Tax=Phormidesmis priestleyi TaxID=268141 RepID=UPI001FD10A5F|nr:J domain-containing protein [Phormidesmis priestleyi]